MNLSTVVFAALLGISQNSDPPAQAHPGSLMLGAPVESWDSALPLGNGWTGGLLWGGDRTIKLSLDRGDLWDLRTPEIYRSEEWNYQTMQRLQRAGDQQRMEELFDDPYVEIPYPTKLPTGRLEISLPESVTVRSFELDLERALATVRCRGAQLQCFFSATRPVTILRVEGALEGLQVLRPDGLDLLDYPAAEWDSEGNAAWMLQQCALGLRYAVVVTERQMEDHRLIALAITRGDAQNSPVAAGRLLCKQALDIGFDGLLAEHDQWWKEFWATSSVQIPDQGLQFHYDLVKYFYGAASRAGAPPIPLQGVWTADAGGLPPWKGDYHNDLNTQMTYLAFHTAGLFDQGKSWLDLCFSRLERFREFARDFYGVEGAVVPGVMALDGQPLAGWGQYSLSPTNGAWVAQSFYHHWRYTLDEEFLEDRAYPFCSAVGEGLLGLLQENDAGKLRLPLSTSPEVFDNTMAAWLEPNSNYDQSLLQWLFRSLGEMADAAGRPTEAARWREAFGRLEPLDIDLDASLTIAPGQPFKESHRHFSHAMAIHPLGTLHVDGSELEREVLTATLDRVLATGSSNWTGYSFAWMACMLARGARPESALQQLRKYARAFVGENGFHLNGDQTDANLSEIKYRIFTLEGNFLAMEAIQEMLLQSWGGTLRVFPAVSEKWLDASFENLRAQGALVVSARRQAGQTVWVRIRALADGQLRLRDPFDGRRVTWNLPGVKKVGRDYEYNLPAGVVLFGQAAVGGAGEQEGTK